MMEREFNVTGLCVPHKHYMVDISSKVKQIKELIDKGHYFTINRARQYGKTTTISTLRRTLSDEYTVISLTFEGLGTENFATPEKFCQKFIQHISKALRFTNVREEYRESWKNPDVVDFDTLSDHITDMCEDKEIVLLIDEVDKTSNNQVFLDFLSMLRKKYLAAQDDLDSTFHSIVLVGVYDVRNLKWKIKLASDGKIESTTKVLNSPWNIAVDFEVNMSFDPEEISTMLIEYENDHKTGMDVKEMSEQIYFYTSGYPFLVSRICQHIHNPKKLNKDWSIEGIRNAVKIIQEEKSTLSEDLYKNLHNNDQLSKLIKRMLLGGEKFSYNHGIPEIDLGTRYGYFTKDEDRGLVISNKIFENLLIEYFVDLNKISGELPIIMSVRDEFVQDGKFNMQACLERFAMYYPMIYSEKSAEFLEKEGLLIFLMLLIPALNSKGSYYVESKTRNEERMDLVIAYGGEEFIVELKKWKGIKKHEAAYAQLNIYLESRNASTGYLLTFDFRKKKQPKSEWIEYKGKKIFDVVV